MSSLRKHETPLPKSMDGIMGYIQRVLGLSQVIKLEVTPSSITVWRQVADGEPVVPDELREVVLDVSALLEGIELTGLDYDPEVNPYYALVEATALLRKRNLHPTHILTQNVELLSAWLGFDQDVTHVLGLEVAVYNNEKYGQGRVVLTGAAGSSSLLSDVTHGVVVDMGV